MAQSDEDWMVRLRADDDDAVNVLVAKYRAPVIHFLYRMVHEGALAEDLAQEVFLRVYRARKSYQPRARFSTWLFRIATNVALNALRDGRMQRAVETSLEKETGPSTSLGINETPVPREFPDPGLNVEQEMLEVERQQQIRRAIGALPEKQRLAVVLHKYQELDYAEIAELLDCSEAALKSLLFRAYETLRVKLRPLLGARV